MKKFNQNNITHIIRTIRRHHHHFRLGLETIEKLKIPLWWWSNTRTLIRYFLSFFVCVPTPFFFFVLASLNFFHFRTQMVSIKKKYPKKCINDIIKKMPFLPWKKIIQFNIQDIDWLIFVLGIPKECFISVESNDYWNINLKI